MKGWITVVVLLFAIAALPVHAKDGQQEKVVGIVADVSRAYKTGRAAAASRDLIVRTVRFVRPGGQPFAPAS